MPLAKRAVIYSGEYRDLVQQGWYPSQVCEYIAAFRVDPYMHEFACWMIKEDDLKLMHSGKSVYTGPDIMVFIKLTTIEFVQDELSANLPRYVVPYWWPNDPERTIRTAKVTMAVAPAETGAGIMAIGRGNELIEYLNDVEGQFDIIVLGPENLGGSPNNELYKLGAQGFLRGPQRYHIACGVVPNEAVLTYGEDFTSLRIPDDQQRNRDV